MAVVLYEFTLPEWVGSAGATLSEHSDVTEGSVVPAIMRAVIQRVTSVDLSRPIVRMEGCGEDSNDNLSARRVIEFVLYF